MRPGQGEVWSPHPIETSVPGRFPIFNFVRKDLSSPPPGARAPRLRPMRRPGPLNRTLRKDEDGGASGPSFSITKQYRKRRARRPPYRRALRWNITSHRWSTAPRASRHDPEGDFVRTKDPEGRVRPPSNKEAGAPKEPRAGRPRSRYPKENQFALQCVEINQPTKTGEYHEGLFSPISGRNARPIGGGGRPLRSRAHAHRRPSGDRAIRSCTSQDIDSAGNQGNCQAASAG